MKKKSKPEDNSNENNWQWGLVNIKKFCELEGIYLCCFRIDKNQAIEIDFSKSISKCELDSPVSAHLDTVYDWSAQPESE